MASKIFISYRRSDSAGYAGRVMDRLAHEFQRDLVFLDVDSIPLGTNFAKVLHEEVAKCGVLLAVIGPNWPDARDEEGNRRLNDPNDFVRIEIAAALQRDIPVIPILLDGARIPKADQLPDDLKELSSRSGLDVRHASFHDDIERLIRDLRDKLGQTGPLKGVDLRELSVSEILTKTPDGDAPTQLGSVAREYAKEIHDQFGYSATWLPTALVKVGDVGTVEQGIFTTLGTLRDFGVAFTEQVHPEKANLGYASPGVVSVNFKGADDAPVTGSAAVNVERDVEVLFKRANAILFQAAQCTTITLLNLRQVSDKIVFLFKAGKWPTNQMVVTEVIRSAALTALVSAGTNARATLTIKGELGPANAQLASANASFGIKSSSSIAMSIVSQENLTPLFRARGIRTSHPTLVGLAQEF